MSQNFETLDVEKIHYVGKTDVKFQKKSRSRDPGGQMMKYFFLKMVRYGAQNDGLRELIILIN